MSPELGRTGLRRLESVGLGSRGLVEDEKRLSLPSSRIVPYKKEDVFPRNILELPKVALSPLHCWEKEEFFLKSFVQCHSVRSGLYLNLWKAVYPLKSSLLSDVIDLMAASVFWEEQLAQ
jgi:hypothetical protein